MLRSGIAPGKTTPAAPPPAHPPPRMAVARGWGPEPRCGCAPRAGAGARGSATHAGCPGCLCGSRSPPGLRSCEDPGYPSITASRPGLCHCAALRAAQVATVHPGRVRGRPPLVRRFCFLGGTRPRWCHRVLPAPPWETTTTDSLQQVAGEEGVGKTGDVRVPRRPPVLAVYPQPKALVTGYWLLGVLVGGVEVEVSELGAIYGWNLKSVCKLRSTGQMLPHRGSSKPFLSPV